MTKELEYLINIISSIIIYLVFNYFLKKKLNTSKIVAKENTKIKQHSFMQKTYQTLSKYLLNKQELEIYNYTIVQLDNIYTKTNSTLARLTKIILRGIGFFMFLYAIEFGVTLISILLFGDFSTLINQDNVSEIIIFIFSVLSIISFLMIEFFIIRKAEIQLDQTDIKELKPYIFLLPIIIFMTPELRVLLAIYKFLFKNMNSN